jgi:hypothetical protein
MTEIIMSDPSVSKVIDEHGNPSRELAFAFYVLWMCAHAYAMRQRKVLDDNEWAGWMQFLKNCFRRGIIGDIWKQIESDQWFNPAFQKFINTEIVTRK